MYLTLNCHQKVSINSSVIKKNATGSIEARFRFVTISRTGPLPATYLKICDNGEVVRDSVRQQIGPGWNGLGHVELIEGADVMTAALVFSE